MDFLGRAKTFVRIVEARSFSGAARSLGVSLAAISRQVTSLEKELGAPLLVRTTRHLELTDEGVRFHEHAVRLVREADAARASVRSDRAVSGVVRMSASVTLGVNRIVPALPALLRSHPALQIDLQLEDRAADLVGEGFDLAVRAGLSLPDTASLVAQPLATYPRVLVASPAYLKANGTPRTVAALVKHAVVLGSGSGMSGVWRFVEEGEARAVTVGAKLRVTTLLAICAAARAGLGIALLPAFVVGDDVHDGALRVLLREAAPAPVLAHALYRVEHRGSPRIEAVVDWLRATMPERGSPSRRARAVKRSGTRRADRPLTPR